MTLVGLIGCGGMARDVVAALHGGDTASGVRIVGALDELLARKPTLVAEVAGQAAVAEHADAVLRRGLDCLLISVGALADAALLGRLKSAAREGNSRMLL